MTSHAPTFCTATTECEKPGDSVGNVEVTPAMIDAGLEQYNAVWTDLRDARDGADALMLRQAFLAMIAQAAKSRA